MKFSVTNLNAFLFFKLPAAFICGVRVKQIDDNSCYVTVKQFWMNQNPFQSMYFAVQAMAAELSTGILVMNSIQDSGKKFSMLVISSNSSFTKKATGRISFICKNRELASKTIQEAMATGEAKTFWMKSIGTNENGEQVSEMDFEWSIKLKFG